MKKIYGTILLASALLLSACDNFLDVKSESQTTLDTFFQNEADCRAATAPLYNKVWFDFNNNFGFGFMDGRANNVFAPWSDYIYPYVNLTETTATANLYSAWQSLFVIITQSDYTLNNLDRALEHGVSEEVVNECKGECRFMRGIAYWYLAMSWGNVPIIEDPQTLITNPLVNTNPTEDVLAFAIKDMEFAAANLPEKPATTGRVTKYSAQGMLSRFYNTAAAFVRGGNTKTGSLNLSASEYYSKAKASALDVIDNSDRSLMKNYEDLFKVQNNDNSETLFNLQWVPNSDYGTINFSDSYLALSSTVVGGRSAWGNATYGSGELIELFSRRNDLIRLKATYFTEGCYYDYIRSDEGGYLVGTGSGYYDENGEFVTVSKDSYTDIRAWIKKGVVGCSEDTGGLATNQNSCLKTPMLRLADVMLHYCEAAIGEGTSTSDPKAIEVFNAIRSRAGLAPVSEITMDGDNGLWNERRCELALEYVAWPDFVRRAYYQQDWVLDFMGKQNRNASFSYSYPTNTFEWSTADDGTIEKVGGKEEETPSASRLTLPYPESELIKNQLLKAEPVPYEFND
ncbi:MAG: RagB/SusD family nutrient uptake outer membrane protein [Bacteroidales bacterium]|nr:RagB/SusD family nutrient uptake outer membrane protein [Bacteroidales bacterium]